MVKDLEMKGPVLFGQRSPAIPYNLFVTVILNLLKRQQKGFRCCRVYEGGLVAFGRG